MPASRISSTSCQRCVVLGAGGVGVGQLIDEHEAGMAGDDSVGVHLLQHHALILDLATRDDLQPCGGLTGQGPVVGLDEADDDVGRIGATGGDGPR